MHLASHQTLAVCTSLPVAEHWEVHGVSQTLAVCISLEDVVDGHGASRQWAW